MLGTLHPAPSNLSLFSYNRGQPLLTLPRTYGRYMVLETKGGDARRVGHGTPDSAISLALANEAPFRVGSPQGGNSLRHLFSESPRPAKTREAVERSLILGTRIISAPYHAVQPGRLGYFLVRAKAISLFFA